MSTSIALPAPLAVTPQILPQCCTRHGQPAAISKKTIFSSRPPAWAWAVFIVLLPTFLLDLIVILIVVLTTRKQSDAPAWPYCHDCLTLRRQRLACAYEAGPRSSSSRWSPSWPTLPA